MILFQHTRTVKLNLTPINGAILMSNTVSNPTKERTEDPEFIKGPDIGREAIRETAKELKTEAAREVEAEDLKDEALKDRIKDVERAARIEQLEAGDDLVEENRPALKKGALADGNWHSVKDEKIKPAKVEKTWYTKPARAQRRELQKKLGSYAPEHDDPISQRLRPKGISNGSLFDMHPLSRIRIRDVVATATIKEAKPAPLPIKPVHPGAAEEPIPGRCWECYTPLRKRDRKGTKFCTNTKGECRNTYTARAADRAEQEEVWKAWEDRQHEKRMFSIHCRAADALYYSALRCGLDVTFTADEDGVLAVHARPLPPIVPQSSNAQILVHLNDEGGAIHAFQLGVQRIYGSNYHEVEVVATATAAGTLFTFKLPCRPEGTANYITLGFEGDPGEEWRSKPDPDTSGRTSSLPTREPAPTPMSAMYAARNGRTAEYLAKRDLAA